MWGNINSDRVGPSLKPCSAPHCGGLGRSPKPRGLSYKGEAAWPRGVAVGVSAHKHPSHDRPSRTVATVTFQYAVYVAETVRSPGSVTEGRCWRLLVSVRFPVMTDHV